ncbi:MAG: hypothetical protein II888_03910 [Clostridia bacterium]|nr:hypothetical protein [Clostridia bacterium]
MFEQIQRIPDTVMIEEREARPEDGKEGRFSLGDVTVWTEPGAAGMPVRISAGETPVRKVRLRWHTGRRLRGQVLGDAWERTLRFGVNTLAFRMPQHRAFFDIDADCIGISERIDWKYNRQWGELLARSGTSLFYSLKPDTLPPEQERELDGMLRENAEPHAPAEPLDWMETALPQEWKTDAGEQHFSWYEPWGLRVACGTGPVWEKVWREVSRDLG